MILIRLSEDRYAYDVQTLVKNFYPAQAMAVEILEEMDNGIVSGEPEEMLLTIRYKENAIGISLALGGIPILENETETDGTGNDKNRLKIGLYRLLSQHTGKTFDWGTLTGVRPTKLPMAKLEEGFCDAEVYRYMEEEYLCSREKAELSLEIARTEQRILDEIDYTNGYSIYIGIPFCPTTCLYCSFTSYSVQAYKEQVEEYLAALFQEIDYASRCISGKRLTTVYVGGGTPTALNENQLKSLLEKIRQSFDFTYVAEFTVEAGRPDSITPEKLKLLKEYGAGRISINPQTMKQETLERIGRRHTVEQVKQAFYMAREAGHDNINMDLIVGLPGETLEDVEMTLEEIKKLKPDSITIHSLVTKRAARLNREKQKEEPVNVDEMSDLGRSFAAKIGYLPYYMYRQKNAQGSGTGANQENIGYAFPGKEGIYNILIMEEKHTILALGAGATSKFVFQEENRIERVENVKSLKDYIERIDEMIERKKAFFRKEML